MFLSFFRNCRALIEQERRRATTDEEAPPRREYSSARSRQFQMHLKQHVFQNVYVSRRTYTPRHPVQDWERENSWAINAAGMSLIILVRWKEGKEEGSLRHRDFSSTPIPWTTTSFINVSSVVFFPRFFCFSLSLCFSFTFFSVCDISFPNYLPDLQKSF